MTNNLSGISTQSGDWQLLAGFETSPIDGNINHLADKISGIVLELMIPTLQMEKILGYLVEIVGNASFLQKPENGFSPVYLRIWVASERASGRGWGFFIVERPDIDSKNSPETTIHSVELFLYQEQQS